MTDPIIRRKSDDQRKRLAINMRVTEAELKKIHELAAKAGKTVRDYLVDKALGKRK